MKHLLLFLIALTFQLSSSFGQSVQSINPISAHQGTNNLNVTITGLGTSFVVGSPTAHDVWLTQGTNTLFVSNELATSTSQIIGNLSVPTSAPLGFYDVHVNGVPNSLVNGFEVTLPPVTNIVNINPGSANQGANLNVTITGLGTSFVAGSSTNAWLTQGTNTIHLTGEIGINATLLQGNLAIPINAQPGFYDVHALGVTNPLIDGFEVTVPPATNIVNINPGTANQGANLNVTITGLGTSFVAGSSTNAWLTQGTSTIHLTGEIGINATHLQGNLAIPINAQPGFYDVHALGVTNPLIDGFEVIVPSTPSLVSISPATSQAGNTVFVTIAGVGTNFSGNPPTVWIQQGSSIIASNAVIPLNANYLQTSFSIPANASIGSYHVGVSTVPSPLVNGFYVSPPGIVGNLVSITPDNAEQGQTLAVTITGMGTAFNSGTSTNMWLIQGSVTIQGTAELGISPTQLTANLNIPAFAPTGFYDVWVNSVAAPLVNGFEVHQGINLTQISPDFGEQGQLIQANVQGFGTAFDVGPPPVVFIQQGSNIINGTNVSVLNATSLNVEFNIPTQADIGIYDLFVSGVPNPLTAGFSVLTPSSGVLQSISPNWGQPGDSLTVIITGNGTTFGSAGPVGVVIGSGLSAIAGSNVNVISTDSLSAEIIIPIGTFAAFYDVWVSGVSSPLTNGFEVWIESGIEELDADQSLIVYPNPVHHQSQISYSLSGTTSVTFELIDLTGRILNTIERGQQSAGKYQLPLPLDQLSKSGLYLVRMRTDESTQVFKFQYFTD